MPCKNLVGSRKLEENKGISRNAEVLQEGVGHWRFYEAPGYSGNI